jgi:hypothetical protein
MHFIQHCSICRLSDSTVSQNAGIETRTVATLALALGSQHALTNPAGSNPLLVKISFTTRLDIIHTQLLLIHFG